MLKHGIQTEYGHTMIKHSTKTLPTHNTTTKFSNTAVSTIPTHKTNTQYQNNILTHKTKTQY